MPETAPLHAPAAAGPSSSGQVPPKAYYVIIGRGFSAVLNHVTLRLSEQGKKRLGDLPVMHIGFEDPWSYYRRHRMGQFPHLLALPGFSAGIGDEDPGEYKDSTRFAEATRREFQLLTEKYTVVTKEGWVAVIQPHGFSEGLPEVLKDLAEVGVKPAQMAPLREKFDIVAPYRLLVIDPSGKPELVYAQKIDICTGGGIPRLLDEGTMNAELYAAYQGKPWVPPERRTEFRHVLCSYDALYRTSLWPEGPRVCVHGRGGVALNVVETALEAQKWVDWTATEDTHEGTFAQSRRNRELLREGSAAGAWTPSSTRLRLGEPVEVKTVKVESSEAVDVTFHRIPKAVTPQMTDHRSHKVPLADGRFPYSSASEKAGAPGAPDMGYSQLIVARGFVADDEKLPGTAAFLIRLVGKAEKGLSAIVSPDERWIGLKSGPRNGTGPVRILGVAATSYREKALRAIDPNFMEPNEPRDLTLQYLSTLPLQTHVAGLAGIAYNAVSIALANDFTAPTINANTASSEELTSILGKDLGPLVLEARQESQHGFRTLDELLTALTALAAREGDPPPDGTELLGLSFDYL